MKKYAALSVVAPAGELIRAGRKTLEIRKWQPETLEDLLIVQNSIVLGRSGQAEDPLGRALALVDIESVSPWLEEELDEACGKYWEPGWLAWRIKNVRPFDFHSPVPAKLGIYEVEI